MARIAPRWRHVLVRHEQGGTHMAEGYAKTTGRAGTVLVTSGPGATNCVTGIADAYMDSVPLVVFTGQVPTHLIGGDAFQETDIIGVTRSITKHSFQVRSADDLAPTIRAAYHIAETGRPGPVVVDLPKDILATVAAFSWPETTDVGPRGYAFPESGDAAAVRAAAEMLNASERPVFYVGGGTVTSGAAAELTEMARHAGVPVTTTLHGLGAFPEDGGALALGMLGMHGTWVANQAIQNADLIVAVGARFDDRVTGRLEAWAPHARIVHIDIDPACLSKNVPVDVAICGNVRDVLRQMRPHVAPRERAAWHARIAAWREEAPLDYQRDAVLRPQGVVRTIRAITEGQAVVVTDVGQHQMWTAQHFGFVRPRGHITSGGLGTMGFSVPAAIGAAFGLAGRYAAGDGSDREAAAPSGDGASVAAAVSAASAVPGGASFTADAAVPVVSIPVVSISGDGGFVMNAQELAIASQYRLPVVFVVVNNSFLGMVRQWQELFHEERYSHTDLSAVNPDFVALAAAYRVPGVRADTPERAESALRDAFAHVAAGRGPILVECVVARDEMVFPMVPAGAATDEMILTRCRFDG